MPASLLAANMALNIENWITENPLTIDSKQALGFGLAEMAELNVGAILIEENGKLVGIFTERDLLKLFASIGGLKADHVLGRPIESKEGGRNRVESYP